MSKKAKCISKLAIGLMSALLINASKAHWKRIYEQPSHSQENPMLKMHAFEAE